LRTPKKGRGHQVQPVRTAQTDATASDAVSPHLVTFNRGIDRLGIPPAAQG